MNRDKRIMVQNGDISRESAIQGSTAASQRREQPVLPPDFSSRVMAAIETEGHRREARSKALLYTLYCFIGALCFAGTLFAFDKFDILSLKAICYQGIASATSLASGVVSALSRSFAFFVHNKILLIIVLSMAALGGIGQIVLKSQQSQGAKK